MKLPSDEAVDNLPYSPLFRDAVAAKYAYYDAMARTWDTTVRNIEAIFDFHGIRECLEYTRVNVVIGTPMVSLVWKAPYPYEPEDSRYDAAEAVHYQLKYRTQVYFNVFDVVPPRLTQMGCRVIAKDQAMIHAGAVIRVESGVSIAETPDLHLPEWCVAKIKAVSNDIKVYHETHVVQTPEMKYREQSAPREVRPKYDIRSLVMDSHKFLKQIKNAVSDSFGGRSA